VFGVLVETKDNLFGDSLDNKVKRKSYADRQTLMQRLLCVLLSAIFYTFLKSIMCPGKGLSSKKYL